jgi:hypothetical protein
MSKPRPKAQVLLTLIALTACAALLVGLDAATPAVKTYAPDDGSTFANPERGLYHQFTSQAERDPLTLEAVETTLGQDDLTLMLRMYYLKTFRDRPLSDKQLDMIRSDFNIIRQAGVKCILRFAYSQAIGEPDAPIDVVLGHMDQLAPIIRDNADVILTAQAGFVGAWGEWHASTNDLAEPHNAKKIVHKWLEILPGSRTVQLRTPRQKWMILDDKTAITAEKAFQKTPIARLGHHNDCFISSETDVGTYEDIENEKAYLNAETTFLPMGGETCALTQFSDPDNARAEMENLHFTYLNLGYHPEVLEKWRNDGFFKEVANRLGYRLSLESFSAPASLNQGDDLPIQITLINTGFAAPCNPRSVQLILQHTGAAYETILPIAAEPRAWLPGEPIEIAANLRVPDDLPPGEYKLLLALPDPEPTLRDDPAYAIRLANPGLWDAQAGRHDLGVTLSVEKD